MYILTLIVSGELSTYQKSLISQENIKTAVKIVNRYHINGGYHRFGVTP
jgi:hypothetical protein